MRRLLQDSQLRFYLALAFLVWTVLPHVSVYRHAHAGDAGHGHATLTPAQVRIANQVAEALPAEAGTDFGGEALPPSRPGSGEPACRPAPDIGIHAHFQQDPNVAAMRLLPLPVLPAPAPDQPFAAVPSAPDLGHRFERQARGPPSLPSA